MERILPKQLAERWRHVPLPTWVGECCRLPRDSTIQALATAELPAASDVASRSAIEFFVVELLRTRAREISDMRVFPTNAAINRSLLTKAGCSRRAMNALHKGGLLKNPARISGITYGDLLEVKGLGIKSLLNVAFCAEALNPSHAIANNNLDVSEAFIEMNGVEIKHELKELAATEAAEIISGGDSRFSDLLPPNVDSLSIFARSMEANAPQLPDSDARQMALPINVSWDRAEQKYALQWVRTTKERISHIESLQLEDLLSEYLHACTGFIDRRLEAVLARLGWSGNPPMTLEESGELLGVTRERMRQIEKKAREKFSSIPVYAPALSRAINILLKSVPIEVSEAAALLRRTKVSKTKFSPESVIAAATDLGIDSPFAISTVRALRMVTQSEHTEHTRLILSIARKKSGASGVANIADVAAKVGQIAGESCTPDEAQKTLDASEKFRHVVGGWYCATDLPEGRNRLVNLCRKMLSATSPISVSRMREGVKREYMFRNLTGGGRFDLRVPPADAMKAFLSTHPEFCVEGDIVRAVVPLDYRRELGEMDRVLVDALRSNPSAVLDRASLVGECIRRGVNGQAANIGLTYSCMVEHIDTNIWALRGADVSPAAIEALRLANALRPRESRVRNFGWTAEGKIWIAASAPPATQVAVIGCPSGSKEYLAGQKFVAAMSDGTPCGTIGVTKDGTLYGFGAFQRLSGWDPGDLIVIEFSLENSTATLILGSEELLDTYEKV